MPIHINSDYHLLQTWQIEYRLYTTQQQLYFTAFIVAIVAMMKYVDIEFDNQPVVIPFPHSHRDDINSITEQKFIGKLLQPIVQKEQKREQQFRGYTIPPTGIWKADTDKQSSNRQSKTAILRRMAIYPSSAVDEALLFENTSMCNSSIDKFEY